MTEIGYQPRPERSRIAGVSPRVVRVCIVVAVGVAGAMPLSGWLARRALQESQCQRMLRIHWDCMQLYANERRGMMPPDLATLLKSMDAFGLDCPAGGTYRYVGNAGIVLASLPPDAIIIYETNAPHRGGGHALYANGNVTRIGQPEADAIRRQCDNGTWPIRVPAGASIP